MRRKAQIGAERAPGRRFRHRKEAQHRTPGKTHDADTPRIDRRVLGQKLEGAERVRQRIADRARPAIAAAIATKRSRAGGHMPRRPHIDHQRRHAGGVQRSDVIRLRPLRRQARTVMRNHHGGNPT